MKHFLRSFAFTLRQWSKAPANALMCLLILAGCIALVTSMFRLTYVAFLWQYPYENASRIVMLQSVYEDGNTGNIWSFGTMDQLTEKQDTVFTAYIPAFCDGSSIKAGTGEGRSVGGYAYIGWDFCQQMGASPMMGRAFTADDARADAAPVALISEKLWRGLYNATPEIIGRTVTLLGRERVIVGVMADGFTFPASLDRPSVQVWVPFEQGTLRKESGWVSRASLYGVLGKGVSVSQGNARFSSAVAQVVKALPEDNKGIVSGKLRPINGGYVPDKLKDLLAATSACSLLVLVMGCCIVSGLLSARYTARMQELTIRTALGAARSQLVLLMLTEFAMVSCAAVVVGLLMEQCFDNAFLSGYIANFGIPPHMLDVSGGWSFAFVALLMCLVTFVSSLLPALRASRTDVSTILKESTRTGSSFRVTRMSNFVIASQVAMACLVLFGGAILYSKLAELHDDETYFDPGDYLSAQFLFDSSEHPDGRERARICMSILDELKASPEIEKVGITTEVYGKSGPQWGSGAKVCIEGTSYASYNDLPDVLLRVVSPGYFASINVPLLRGREFEVNDDLDHMQVAAVTDVFARKYFGGVDEAMGRYFRLWSQNGTLYRVIAVVPDIYNSNGAPDMKTGVFIPYTNIQWEGVVIYLKGQRSPMHYKKLLEDTIHKVDSRLVIFRTVSMRQMRDQQGWGVLLKFVITYFSLFAFGALVMVAGGLYGVISLSVGLRRTELGIRLALGADPWRLVGLFMVRGAVYVAAGLIVGLLGTVVLRHELAGIFDGRLTDSWLAYGVVLTVLLGVAAVAIGVPSSRSALVEPAQVLHDE
jgi:predicted permease